MDVMPPCVYGYKPRPFATQPTLKANAASGFCRSVRDDPMIWEADGGRRFYILFRRVGCLSLFAVVVVWLRLDLVRLVLAGSEDIVPCHSVTDEDSLRYYESDLTCCLFPLNSHFWLIQTLFYEVLVGICVSRLLRAEYKNWCIRLLQCCSHSSYTLCILARMDYFGLFIYASYFLKELNIDLKYFNWY